LEAWINHVLKKYDSVSIFISPSRFVREKAIEYGWNPQKIVHIPNFTETQSINGSSTVGSYNLYFGRLSREKGVHTLLLAYETISDQIPLVIVGDGPERGYLGKMAEDKVLPVRFTGYLSGGALNEAIANSRSVILPSECYENAPLALLEAFAYGKPVVGARIGGIPEMIEDGVNGLLFESGNVEDLREKLVLMASMTDQEIASMGHAAREKVEKEYNAEAHYKKLMEVYSKALGKPCE
jgi:glycosyltransferase involved in cell wall biosynthesis